MRILFIADYYPPLERGGYAQLCQDLANELRRRGHDVTVLAAEPKKRDVVCDEEQVIRRLQIPVSFEDHLPIPFQQMFLQGKRQAHNRRLFEGVLRKVDPAVVLFWPSGYVDPALMTASEANEQLVTAYYLAGVTPQQPSVVRQYWSYAGHSPTVRRAKSLLGLWLRHDSRLDPPLLMRHVLCVSEHERQRAISFGLVPAHAEVIHNGIDLVQFPFHGLPSKHRDVDTGLRVLYAGRLVETKGAHTAVEAVKWLRLYHPTVQVSLTLLGAGPDSYVQALKRQIADEDLGQRVTQQAWIQREHMPNFMTGFDVLVLPTIHPEPLARVVQEAMALGLNVIATPTGGTPELVMPGRTGMLFAPGDAAELGSCLLQFNSDLSLCDRLAMAALQAVKEEFTIQVMGARVEERLQAWQTDKRESIERKSYE